MHLTADELDAVARGVKTRDASSHLQECPSCRNNVSQRRLEQALADPLTWILTSDKRSRASEQVDVALPAFEQEVLARLRHAHEALFSDPRHALEMTRDIEQDLDASTERDAHLHVRVLALRERANALFRLGRFDDVLATIEEAASFARQLPVSEYELAILAYIRASVLAERGDYTACIEAASEAFETLEAFGDEERALNARVLGAVALFDSGNREAALAAHEAILERGGPLSDVLTATLLQNRAWCLVGLGRLREAEEPLGEAESYYARNDMPVELTRVQWTRALIAARTDQHKACVDLLQAVAAAFERLGMRYEAATARVDLIDQLLKAGDATEVPRLASEVAAVFAKTESRTQLAEALAILRNSQVHGTTETEHAIELLRRDIPGGHPLDRLFS